MNYINQLLGYRRKRLVQPVGTNSIALYFILFEYCNDLGFPEWFTAANSTLQGLSGLAIGPFQRARAELVQKGFVSYRSSGGNRAGRYQLVDLTELQTEQQSGQHGGRQVKQQVGQQSNPDTGRKSGRKADGSVRTLNKQVKSKDIQAEELFETLWKGYPSKKGKAQVTMKDKLALAAVGREEMERALARYLAGLRRDEWRRPQNGSTFFHSGYIDYLDANTAEEPVGGSGYEGVAEL